jgi:hypothetical protein
MHWPASTIRIARKSRWLLAIVVVLVVSGCGGSDDDETRASPAISTIQSEAGASATPSAADRGTLGPALNAPAPELATIEQWYNTPPLTIAELRGSPILLVFWAWF